MKEEFQSLLNEAICSLEKAISRDLDLTDPVGLKCAFAAHAGAHYIYGYIDAMLANNAGAKK
jgi:hypothetical protein